MTSPHCEIIFVSYPSSNSIFAFDLASGSLLAHLSGCPSPHFLIPLAGKSPLQAGKPLLVAASSTETTHIFVWSWSSPAPSFSFPTPEPVLSMAATCDGQYLFSGGFSGQIHSFSTGKLLRSFFAHRSPVTHLVVSDDDSLLVSAAKDGSVSVWPLIRVLDFSCDSTAFPGQFATLSGGPNGDPGCFPTRFGGFPARMSAVSGLSVGPGALAVTSWADGTCATWSMMDASCVHLFVLPCTTMCLAVDPIGNMFYAGGPQGRVYAAPFMCHPAKVAAAAGPIRAEDVSLVVAGSVHDCDVAALAVGPRRNLVCRSRDGNLRVLDLGNGDILLEVGPVMGPVADVAVASNSGQFSSALKQFPDSEEGFTSDTRRFSRDVVEMEEWLKVVEDDRRRGLDCLERAIGTYERILNLFLKEASSSSSSSSSLVPK
ncbi:protein ROOT INITIATION DEFECTIVE 3 [Amborella trichopoda]|uniref:Uncharacterized protein n=1 Tax=Amborella trichopoda TaxID=13333 RepID=W1PG74_AMBTC|nr:protein ROOT INITIATION DEFECTIVE 3 [Amborella trichopoda]ERN09007.1 hypothetical protein AMTR_s00153p00075290 [Amborella trichopoda]|eukprot:XP_006847426.1 protein ROOT INITIATION DEFECTIVE 3 [Amborella trichopoda]